MNWDLRYENPPGGGRGYDISATPGLTPMSPQGPLVAPGVYTVTLTVDGQKYVQKVTVINDPRSPAGAREVSDQHALQMALYHGALAAVADAKAVTAFKDKISALQAKNPPKNVADALSAMSDKLGSLGASVGTRPGLPVPSFANIQSRSVSYLARMEFGDMGPSQPVRDSVDVLAKDLEVVEKAWKAVQNKDCKAVDDLLAKAGLPPLNP